MPRLSEAKKDVISCDKSRGIGTYELIREFPNGATQHVEDMLCRKTGEPGELKHLSTRRKRKQK